MSNNLNKKLNPIEIKLNEEKYEINLSLKSEEIIALSINLLNSDFPKKYKKKYTKKQLLFLDEQNPLNKFYDLLKDNKFHFKKENNFLELKLFDEESLIYHILIVPLKENREIVLFNQREEENSQNNQRVEKEINNIKEEINKLKIQNSVMEKTIRKVIENIRGNINESKIINLKDAITIENLINPKTKISFKLLYSTYLDDDSLINFHNKVDKKGATIIIIKANNKIFGAYNPISWDNSGIYKTSNSAFIFSLDKKERYNIKSEEKNYSWLACNNYILFGFSDLCIWNKCKNNECSYSEPCSYNIPLDYEITGGKKYFSVTDFEVYLINHSN